MKAEGCRKREEAAEGSPDLGWRHPTFTFPLVLIRQASTEPPPTHKITMSVPRCPRRRQSSRLTPYLSLPRSLPLACPVLRRLCLTHSLRSTDPSTSPPRWPPALLPSSTSPTKSRSTVRPLSPPAPAFSTVASLTCVGRSDQTTTSDSFSSSSSLRPPLPTLKRPRSRTRS